MRELLELNLLAITTVVPSEGVKNALTAKIFPVSVRCWCWRNATSSSNMNLKRTWDLIRIRAEGLWVSIGRRITSGRLLRLLGDKQVVDGLSDLPTLAEFAEVELTLEDPGKPSTYIHTSSLISNPQLSIGWQLTGLPILIGVSRASQGHMFLNGLTQSGKSTMAARIAYQLTRLYPTVAIGVKAQGPVLIGSMDAIR